MSLTNTVVRRPTTIIIIYILLTVLALVVYPNLSVELFPEMDLPMVIVYSSYRGASPETMESRVTKLIESAVSNVGGIKKISSTSSEGISMVMLEFAYGTDLDKASQSINDNISLYTEMFPEDATKPTIFKLNTNMMPIMNIALSGSSGQDANELRVVLEDMVQSRLERVAGVSSTAINGGQDAFVQVAVDQNRLEAYGLTLSQVAYTLNPQNFQIGAGTLIEGDLSYLLRTDAQFNSIEQIEDAMVAAYPKYDAKGNVIGSNVVRLKDIATVSFAYRDATSQVYINGESGVYLSVSKESDANSVQVAKRVKDVIKELNKELPKGMSLEVIVDNTEMVESTINKVYESLLYGIVLVMVVLFIFLRSVKSTFIIGISIPISMLLTVLVMFFMGYSLNLMTLTGLILGLGMTVDGSIVILENIFRYRERGAKLHAAAILGTKEMIVSITASILTTVCVFVPMVLLRSNLEMLGEILTPMAATIIISLLASLVVAVTLIPVLTSSYVKLYTRKQKPLKLRLLRFIDDKAEAAFEALDRGYKRALALLLDYKWLTLILVILIMVLTFQAYQAMHQSLYPTMSETSVSLSVTLPQGTTLATTESLLMDLQEKAERDIKGYKDITVTAGGGGMFGTGGTNGGSLQISLLDEEGADSMQVVQEKLRRYFDLYPAADFSFSQVSMGLGNLNPVDVAVKSDNLELAVATAEKIRDLIDANLKGVTEVRTDFSKGLPELRITIDRERAYAYNLTMQTIASEISNSVNGITATQLKENGTDTDVVVMLDKDDRSSELDLKRIFIRNALGEKISLDNLATIERSTGPVSINRENEMRTVHVVGGLAPNYAASQAESDIKSLLEKELPLSDEVFIEYGGDFADMTAMFSQVGLILILAVVLVFGVMASLFESFKNPFIVLLSMPLMMVGVVGIYLITGETFSLISAIGIVILAGIVVNNGIVLIEYINLLRKRGLPIRRACIEAGGNRLKPILMTSLTTIFGMIPLAFFGGQGAEQIQPIGQTIIGGMAISTLMTIFFTPVLYMLFNKDKQKKDVERIENYLEEV
ncbi:hydrophobic/amphiphilic exporter-1, HAE1 family [Sphaerochaeta associata]|uniref:Efflux RND transporter permease subunit n=1 Tax=Sphaerochaeta associata TaxID=1129264 RepID=A0ABY4D5V9_9SPIR|nr:efflux RND transporter permease subunit [Sphaerochaeta associata]UOM49668.1 efflux RND transporter permease subunit [Sphaerochaeta associata]SMP48821.1 hydrophobic/amphiphilic exporter-1, HAE1 family [Sphaerochaeta associata]